MKGLIFINPYLIPKESVISAERLKKEFADLGVKTDIVAGADGLFLSDGRIKNEYECDFAIFLDKDKYVSGALKKAGVRLFNSHDAIRCCDDKAETYIALSGSGINIPDTVFGRLCFDKNAELPDEYLRGISEKLGFPIVVKESYGSMGKGVYLAENIGALKVLAEKLKCKPHLFQRYLGKEKGTDVRVIVIGGKAVAVMERRNASDFRSNVALGGECKKIDPPESFIKTAEKCAEILSLDYCGVDLLYGDNDEPFVCEVNSNAFFLGMEKATGINVAGIYAKYVVEKSGGNA